MIPLIIFSPDYYVLRTNISLRVLLRHLDNDTNSRHLSVFFREKEWTS